MRTFWRIGMNRGFTLVEIVCVVVILGLLSKVAYNSFKDAVPTALDRNAVVAAQAINTAKKAYELRVSNAASLWAAATDDAARFLLIRDKITYAESSTLSQYTPSGYSLTLGSSLSTRVSVATTGGRTISY